MNSTIEIAAGIVMLLVLIVWSLIASGRKSTRKKKEALTTRLSQLAEEYDTTLGPSDFLGNRAIAADKDNGRIFYVNNSDDIGHVEVFNIVEVNSCTINSSGSKVTRSSKSGKVSVEEQLNRIQLVVHLRNGANINMPFYDETKDGVLEMLVLKEKAEKWKAFIKRIANK